MIDLMVVKVASTATFGIEIPVILKKVQKRVTKKRGDNISAGQHNVKMAGA
jgi:hypothetical protein